MSLLAAACLLFTGCSSSQKEAEKEREAPPAAQQAPPAEATPPSPAPAEGAKPEADKNAFKVKFETSRGNFIVEVHPDWAPLGAARFKQLVQDKYFDGARFFRVLPGFVVQFGLAADPAKTRKWDKPFKDDPVLRTNRIGSIVFATAGPETRTTQLFINLASNQRLDDQGFAPFGQVIEGMDVVQKIYPGYGERPDQGDITAHGNAYLNKEFPKLDYIR
ncbi:MAG: peptidylprolyl isomerase, partial [Bryobacterales bacterium]|nr:peptidylprolyl isomerase [Bryobacterales bacterium]